MNTLSQSMDGKIIIRLDENGIAELVNIYGPDSDEDRKIKDDEWLLKFKIRDGRVRLGAESFFFQEGHAEFYDNAKYGELKVSESGDPVLVGLRDDKMVPIIPKDKPEDKSAENAEIPDE